MLERITYILYKELMFVFMDNTKYNKIPNTRSKNDVEGAFNKIHQHFFIDSYRRSLYTNYTYLRNTLHIFIEKSSQYLWNTNFHSSEHKYKINFYSLDSFIHYFDVSEVIVFFFAFDHMFHNTKFFLLFYHLCDVYLYMEGENLSNKNYIVEVNR